MSKRLFWLLVIMFLVLMTFNVMSQIRHNMSKKNSIQEEIKIVNKKIEEFDSMPDGTKYLDSEGVTYLKDKNILVGENGKKLIRKNIILLFMEGDLEKIS